MGDPLKDAMDWVHDAKMYERVPACCLAENSDGRWKAFHDAATARAHWEYAAVRLIQWLCAGDETDE